MPTVFTHAAPALCLGLALGPKTISRPLLIAGLAVSVAPDLDSIGYFMGVPYDSVLGHRGFSHSLTAAAVAGILGFVAAPWLKAGRMAAALFFSLAVVSHIVLDAATSGGLGPALFWPFDDSRYFLPKRPIRVSLMNPLAMISGRGLSVLVSELKWVWLPCMIVAVPVWLARKSSDRRMSGALRL